MKIIQPSVLIEKVDTIRLMRLLEFYGRKCYKSESRISDFSYKKFIPEKVELGHESIIEHEKITVLIICDRGISHEIVRHRIASYSQESTRYCNYSKGIFGNEITVIEPFFYPSDSNNYKIWFESCKTSEKAYMDLINNNSSPQEARSVLPNSLKTEVIVTYNMREWRHFFKLRAQSPCHPQMKQISIPLLLKFQELFPELYKDINYEVDFVGKFENKFARVEVIDFL